MPTPDLTPSSVNETANASVGNDSTNSNNDKHPLKQPKKSKLLKRVILTIIFIVIILPIILVGLLSIPSLQRGVIELTPKFIDGLSIEKISGSLQDNLQLHNLNYHSQDIDLTAKNIQLGLDFNCIFNRYICIEKLKVSDFSLKSVAPTAKNDTTATDFQQFSETKNKTNVKEDSKQNILQQLKPLPLGILVKDLQLANLQIDIAQNHIKLAKFNSAIDLSPNYFLDLKPTNIENLALELALNQSQNNSSNFDLSVVKHQLKDGLIPSTMQQYFQQNLPFSFNINDLNIKNSSIKLAENLIEINDGELKAQLDNKPDNNKLAITQLRLNSNLADANLDAKLNLNQQTPLNLNLTLQAKDGLNQFMPDDWKITQQQLNLALAGNLFGQTNAVLNTKGMLNATLNLNAELSQPFIPFSLKLDNQNFAIPLQNPWLQIQHNNLVINGDLNAYKIALKSEVKYQDEQFKTPLYGADLHATGDLYGLTLEPLKITDLSDKKAKLGTAELAGVIKFYPELNIDQQLKLQNLELKNYINHSLKLNGSSQFKLSYSDSLRISLQNIAITSSLNNKAVSLTGEAQSSVDFYLKTQNLTLKLGNNTANFSGILGNITNANSDFKAIINAPNLNGFMSDLGGKLQADINLNGYLTHPNVIADIMANSLKFQDFSVKQAKIKANLQELNQQYQGSLEADINQLKNTQINLKNLHFTANGTEQNHQVVFTSVGEPASANFRFSGKFDGSKQQYWANFAKFNLNSSYGNLHLRDKLALNYVNSTQNLQFNAHCWNFSANNSNLCFDAAKVGANQGAVNFNLKNFDVAMLNKYLKDSQIKLNGALSSSASVKWSKTHKPSIDLDLNSKNMLFNTVGNRKDFKIDLRDITISALMNDANLTSKLSAKINGSPLKANLNIDDLYNKARLNGDIKLDAFDLKAVNDFLPRGDKVSGNLDANIKIAGTPKQPILNGDLTATKIKSFVRQMPFDVKDGELKLHFQKNSSKINGFVKSNNNDVLKLDGDINWQDLEHYKARVNATTDNFYMNVQPYAKLKIKSNVTLTADQNSLNLDGFVNVPWGRISIESLPDSAIELSPDAVIVDANLKPKKIKNSPALKINSNLNLEIGDDVKIDAYGLKGGLTGLVKVKQINSELGLYGNINVKNGRYKAFGQDLLIQKGLLSFSGSPSLVYLNVKAIRNPNNMHDPNVTAGINVTGLADRPKIEVFSNPSMEQQEALSYLLSGSGLGEGDNSSNSAIGLALLSMSLSQSGKTIGKIGETFGISDLNLSTEGNGDNSQVVISGNITPRLEIKYGVGLFSALAELTLRYRILPKLYLQSVTGASNAVDLIYQFEFD